MGFETISGQVCVRQKVVSPVSHACFKETLRLEMNVNLDYAGGMLKSYSQFLQMPDIIIKTRYLGEGFE